MNQSSRWQSVAEMIRRVSSRRGRELTGLYSIEGTRLVERALRAGAPLASVLAAKRFFDAPRGAALRDALQEAGIAVVLAPPATVAALTEGRDLGQVLGLVRLPPPVTLEMIVTTNQRRVTGDVEPPPPLRSSAPLLLLAAVDIIDPGNVGALTRTAHATGATGLLVAGASDPFHPRATRISRGSIFRLPVVRYASAAALLADLDRCGVIPVATAAEGGVLLPDLERPAGPVAVLVGNEAQGLAPEVAAAVPLRVTIPMPEDVDSFSVNAAAAILLYTLHR